MNHKALTRQPRFLAGLLLTVLYASQALAQSGVPFELPPASQLDKLRRALLKTSKGDIVIELFPDIAPWHVANLKYLADKGFFKGKRFLIYYPGYIIQGGAKPRKDGKSILGYSIPGEFSEMKHDAGIFGMARLPDELNPQRDSAPDQFHILMSKAPKMDGRYTIVGKVIAGQSVLGRLRLHDTIENLTVYVRD